MKKPNRTGLTLIFLAGTFVVAGVVATRVLSDAAGDASTPQPTTVMVNTPIRQEGVIARKATSDVVIVCLLPTGFEPAELTHPEGKFLFGVNNRTGLSDVTFQLVHESGRRDEQKRVLEEKIWRKVIEPKPGRYLLRVAGHPEWRCEITITAR